MKSFYSSLIFFLAMSFTNLVNAQTSLIIDPAGDGGFENGSTFAANGWTVENYASNNTNKWFLGTVSTPSAGTNAAYISNDAAGATYNYDILSESRVMFWRDVTFPLGQTAATLTFKVKVNGEGNWDDISVLMQNSATVPNTSTQPAASSSSAPSITNTTNLGTFSIQGTGYVTKTISIPASAMGNATSASTRRLIFYWENDASGGTQPPASIDEIQVVSFVPTPPANDQCANATTLICGDPALSGTTIYATAKTGIPGNTASEYGVWYKVPGNDMNVTVTSVAGTGYDHELVVFSGTCTGLNFIGNADNAVSAGTETYTFYASTGTDYYIYVAHYNTTSTATGDFNIKITCVAPTPMSYVSSTVVQSTTAAVDPGTKNNQIIRTSVVVAGQINPIAVTSLTYTRTGTADITAIDSAVVYYTGTSTTFSTATRFGTAVYQPNGTFVVTGNQPLIGATSGNTTNYFWLVYHLSCGAVATQTVDATNTIVTVGGIDRTPTITDPTGVRTISSAAPTFNTVKNGDWSDPTVWICGSIPPTNMTVVNINHNITVSSGSYVAGNITIAAGASLSITGGALTMGLSSAGAATGNSNRLLTVNGTFDLSSTGTFNLNGGAIFNSGSTFNMSGGTLNADPNDGTSAGSFASTNGGFRLATGNINVTSGAINFLDPMYTATAGTGQSVLSYSHSTLDAAFGTGCTVIFGGGDDVNTANTNGFYYESILSFGTLTIGNGVVAGNDNDLGTNGRRHLTTRQGITSYGTSFKNLTVNSNSQIILTNGSSALGIAGSLVNNGVISNQALTAPSGIFFAQLLYNSGLSILPGDDGANLSGTGYFRNSTANPIPTAQSGNLSGQVTIYQSPSSLNGFTMQMPLTISNQFRIVRGRVNTTSTNFLALGHGTSIPNNGATLTETSGTLNDRLFNTLTSPAIYDGGYIVGPFRRWFTATTNTGQTGIFPIGAGDSSRPAQILFTAAPTTPGYLSAELNLGTGKVPLGNPASLEEPAVTPTTLVDRTATIWNITNEGALTGGTYSAYLTYNKNTDVLDYANTVLVKRANSASAWEDNGTGNPIGTHIASTGSNANTTVARAGLTSFSEFAIAGGNLVLPVTIEYFRGAKQSGNNVLDWKLVCTGNDETNVVLERSTNGVSFTAISSSVLNANNCQLPKIYTDVNFDRTTNYYRLKLTDANGRISYSNVVVLVDKANGLQMVGVVPNPAVANADLHIVSDKSNKVKLSIIDATGRSVSNIETTIVSGLNKIALPSHKLANGVYQIIVVSADGSKQVTRFVKQ